MKYFFTSKNQQSTQNCSKLIISLTLIAATLSFHSCAPDPAADTKSDLLSKSHEPTANTPLIWEKKHLSLDFHPSMGELVLSYPFTVSTGEVVTFESITPDCDCLIVPLPRRKFASGDKGELQVKFLAGTRTGKQERVIAIKLKGQDEVIQLSATIEVPEIISSFPKSLAWKVGEENKSKKITLTLSEALKVTSYQNSSKHFGIELIETESGKTWTVKVTPKNTDKPKSSIIMLRTDYPHRPWDRMMINVRIDP